MEDNKHTPLDPEMMPEAGIDADVEPEEAVEATGTGAAPAEAEAGPAEAAPAREIPNIPRRCSTAILKSMGAGVVPGIGLEYIAVGRRAEIEAILSDLEDIAGGGGAFRLIEGRYGSGKSFLLQLARNNAMERGYMVAAADLSPERRLAGTKGQGLKLYRELMANLSTRTRPEGGALESLLQRWIGDLRREAQRDEDVAAAIRQTAAELQTYVFGYDFAQALQSYWQGFIAGDDALTQGALRWLRGEFEKKSDARFLGVSQIITDDNWYEAVKLLARLSGRLGCRGLIVLIDETVNLYKITNRVSRENNYEKLLAMFNDVMQGRAPYLGLYLGGTPQSVEDARRGLFSYDALKSRLQASSLAKPGLVDFSGPIIRLDPLTNEEIFLLLERLSDVFCAHHGLDSILTEEQLVAFMQKVSDRIGADVLLTPREVTRDFIALMNLLHQNPEATFEALVGSPAVPLTGASADPDDGDDGDDDDDDDSLAVYDL